ncbi:MAG: hypothetical protein WBA54_03125 [Acidaminobacteraceae bacterium]
MIFLISLIGYIIYYKKIEALVMLIKNSISLEQRELLYCSDLSLLEESKEIKKYIVMATIIIVLIDFLIIKMGYRKIYMLSNSLISPIILFSLYKFEIKNKFDETYRKLHMELPIVLQQMYCLLSIDYALEESIKESSTDIVVEVLKKEFDDMYNKLSRGYDLCLALDTFFSDLNSQYILRFKSVLISHYYYGGSSSRENFIALIYDLLGYRVLLLREDGEKIKVKLIIPIIIIFVSTIVSLALPIILNLNA